MSIAFSARLEILESVSLGGEIWRITGKVYDDSLQGYTASNAQIGDAVFDESIWYGTCDRWKIVNIVDVQDITLVCDVTWDDLGPPDLSGPEVCQGAICGISEHWQIAEVPTLTFAKISEALQTRIQNTNNFYRIDQIQGGSGYSTSGYSGLSGYSGISGLSGYSGQSGYSGIQGIDGNSGYSGISGYSSYSGYSGRAAPQYVHTQYTAESGWIVNHNLDQKYVNVQVIDDLDLAISPLEIQFIDNNNLTVWFPENITGRASVVGGSAGEWGHSVIEEQAGGDITSNDYIKVIVCDSASTISFNLPSITSLSLSQWVRIVKLGTGDITINASALDRIDNSSIGGNISCASANVATITLQIIKEGRWISIYRTEDWNVS